MGKSLESGWKSEFDDDSLAGKNKKIWVKEKIKKKSEASGKYKAACWMHFEVYYPREGKKRSRCIHCGATYACDSCVNGTTNMNKHIKYRCKALQGKKTDVTQKALVRQKTLEGYGSKLTRNFSSQEDCRKKLVEMYARDIAFNKDLHQSTESVLASGNVVEPEDPSTDNTTSLLGAIPSKNEKETEANIQHVKEGDANDANDRDVKEGNANFKDAIEGNASQVADMKFSFSSIDHPPKDSDDGEIDSVISDPRVFIQKYHVKAHLSSVLQSIFHNYGDVAANCQLESVSMRAYYLECICSVVQELQSTSLMQMTKAKVIEMLAVLKDVESAKIAVDGLHDILNEVSQSIDVVTQHQTIETAKANCDILLKTARKQLESQMKDLAFKEKELVDAKARVAETRARVTKLEFESSQLNKSIESMKSKVEKLKCKFLQL